jgi:hypothetical protein
MAFNPESSRRGFLYTGAENQRKDACQSKADESIDLFVGHVLLFQSFFFDLTGR